MHVVQCCTADSRAAGMRDNGPRIDPRRFLGEMFSVKRCPGLFLDQRHAVIKICNTPSVAVHVA